MRQRKFLPALIAAAIFGTASLALAQPAPGEPGNMANSAVAAPDNGAAPAPQDNGSTPVPENGTTPQAG